MPRPAIADGPGPRASAFASPSPERIPSSRRLGFPVSGRRPLFLLGALAAFLAFGRQPAGAQEVVGLYVWGDALSMSHGAATPPGTDDEERARLFAFARSHGIRRLYVALDPRACRREAVAALLSEARALGIGVFAVPPAAVIEAWIAPFPRGGGTDPRAVLAWLDAVLDLPRVDGPGFTGIQLDAEPHAARARSRVLGLRRPVWKRARPGDLSHPTNLRLAERLVELLDAIASRLRETAEGSRFAVTIPHWFDGRLPGRSFLMLENGHEVTLAERVQARADFVTVMDYVDPRTDRSVLFRNVAEEIGRGPTEVLLETAPPRRGTGPRPGETLHRGGEASLKRMCRALDDEFARNENYLGCAAHAYLASFGSGEPGWPAAR